MKNSIGTLPQTIRDLLDAKLVKGERATDCATWLREQGYCSELSDVALHKAVRRYNQSIKEKHKARNEALNSAPPRVRARIAEQTLAYIEIGKLKKIEDALSRNFWTLHEKTPPGIAAASDVLRRSAESSFEMQARIIRLSMDAGIIQRAPQTFRIEPGMLTIRNEDDAAAVLAALLDYINRNPDDIHPHLAGAALGVQRMLAGPPPRPEPLSPDEAQILSDLRRQIAETVAERAEQTRAPEPVDAELLTFDDQDTDIEVEPRMREPQGTLIDLEPEPTDDGVPHLSEIW